MENEEILIKIVEDLKIKIEKLVANLSVRIEKEQDCICGNFYFNGKTYPFFSLVLEIRGDMHAFFLPISEYVAYCQIGLIRPPKLSIQKILEDYQVHQFEYKENGEMEVKHFMCENLLEVENIIFDLLESHIK